MKKKLLIAFVVTIILIAIFVLIQISRDSANGGILPLKKGYSLYGVNGGVVEFASKDNTLLSPNSKPFVMLFLSTWCENCLGEAQHFANLESDFEDKVDFYGIFVDKDENIETINTFIKDSNTNFDWYNSGDIAKLIGDDKLDKLPLILLYDANGMLVMKYKGITPEEMIAFDINRLLK